MTQIDYDCWLHWYVTYRCNQNCFYCFDSQSDKATMPLQEIPIQKLMDSLDRLGKVCRFSFIGGEPFLVPNIVEACEEIAKKHYLSFNTNLLPKTLEAFAKRIPPERVVSIISSFHIQEFERTGKVNTYLKNYRLLKDAGFVIWSSIVAHPSLKNRVQELASMYKAAGVDYSYSQFIGNWRGIQYPQGYTQEELDAFDFHFKLESQVEKSPYCNAGYNVVILEPDGDVFRCPMFKESPMGNLFTGFKLDATPFRCPVEFCPCPFKSFDDMLFQKALNSLK